MSEETAVMETATSPWPANLDTATQLVIQSPCMVPDVYQLICDRRNIRKVNVAGHEYTSQEIRCTSFTERLGGSIHEQTTEGLVQVPVLGEPLEVREGQIRPAPARAWEIDWGTISYRTTTRAQLVTQQSYEDLIRDPAYVRAVERYREQIVPLAEAPIRELQAGTIHWEEISPGEGYTSDPIPW